MSEVPMDQIKRMVVHLSRSERMRLAAWLEATLDAGARAGAPRPTRSLYGLWADLGPGASSADIDDVRHELWRNFPREDIA